MTKEISTKELSEILVQAINDEPYFSKDVLIPKVKAIINGFRLRLATNNYIKLENPNKVAKLIRANELHNLEKDFWKKELKQIVGEENIKTYYQKLDEQKMLWDNSQNL